MPKADDSHIIGRRSILHGFIPVAALAAVPARAASKMDDARLIALCREHACAYRMLAETDNWPGNAYGSPEHLASEAQAAALYARQQTILEQIGDQPAYTPAGLAAKAETAKLYLRPLLEDFQPDPDGPEMRIVFQILDDIIAWNKGSLS